MVQPRSLLKEIWKNFFKSLTPRSYWGKIIGKDYMGTFYYEKENTGGRKPSRWFVPVDNNNFQQDIPPEWEAWLRHRRKLPPTEEEIQLNILKMKEVVKKAKKLESNSSREPEAMPLKNQKFPTYSEYQNDPFENLK